VRERLKRLGRRLRYALTPRPTPDRRFEVRRRRSIRLFLTFFLAIELGFALVGATTGGPGALATDRAVAMVLGSPSPPRRHSSSSWSGESARSPPRARRLLAGVVALAQSLFGQLTTRRRLPPLPATRRSRSPSSPSPFPGGRSPTTDSWPRRPLHARRSARRSLGRRPGGICRCRCVRLADRADCKPLAWNGACSSTSRPRASGISVAHSSARRTGTS